MILSIQGRKGSILIFALWVLTLLTVLAVQVGLGIRQRVQVLSRIEKNSQLRWAAESAVKKTVAALRVDLQRNNFAYTPYGKAFRHDNPEKFQNIQIGPVTVHVVSKGELDDPDSYGIVDEERKLNINSATLREIQRLIHGVTGAAEEVSLTLAGAIVAWRSFSDTELEGFASDNYYTNLRYPYLNKHSYFELPEELLLVRGMTDSHYRKLLPHVTVFGDGQVNINTATKEVLIALGLTDVLADKVLTARQGIDGLEFTVDDYVFTRAFDVATEVGQFVKLEEEERKQLDRLNKEGLIKINSDFYSIVARAAMTDKRHTLTARVVFDAVQNQFLTWREQK